MSEELDFNFNFIFNPSDYASLAETAAKQMEEKRKQEEFEELERKRMEEEQNMLRAKHVLEKVHKACIFAASSGKRKAKVMRCNVGEYKRDQSPKHPDNFLLGAALIVYKHLDEKGMKPDIEYWHDGVGMQGGYDIYVRF